MARTSTNSIGQKRPGKAPKKTGGLRSDGERHSDLQDRRGGTYGREPAMLATASELPEGLRRERQSALSPTRGRGGT